jgi:hypothetical protein
MLGGMWAKFADLFEEAAYSLRGESDAPFIVFGSSATPMPRWPGKVLALLVMVGALSLIGWVVLLSVVL